MLNDMRSDMIE